MFQRKKPIASPERFQSVLFRLLITFFLLLVPIFVTGLMIYYIGFSQLDFQITRLLSQQIESRLTEIGTQMYLSQVQMRQLINETSLTRLSGIPESLSVYERYSQINELQERLETLSDSNTYVRQITVYLSKPRYMLRAHPLKKDDWVVAKLNHDEFQTVWDVSIHDGNRVVCQDGNLLYVSQLPLTTAIGVNREPRILFEVDYNLGAIENRLSDLIDGVHTQSLLLFEDGQTLGDTTSDPIWADVFFTFQTSDFEKTANLNLSDSTAYVLGVYSEQIGAWCLTYAPRAEAFQELNNFRTFVFVLTGLFVLVLALYGVRTYRDIHKPLKLLTDAFDRLAAGDMDFQISYDQPNEFAYLAKRFDRMLTELKETTSRLYQQRIFMQQAQIKQLQAQINPHFLYNSLFILENMIAMDDTEAAALLSRKLGEYFRYITRDARNIVPLEEELEHARSYVEVQRIRFGRRIHIEFQESPPEVDRVWIPRLTIQPILENAFVHALEHSKSGNLWVRLLPKDRIFTVEIENTGFEESDEWLDMLVYRLDDECSEQEITGLVNVHRRLKLIYGEGLSFRRKSPQCFTVVIHLPMDVHPDEDSPNK